MQATGPRERRLVSDYHAMEALRRDSQFFTFEVSQRGIGDVPDGYHICFYGPSLEREEGFFGSRVLVRSEHRVQVTLGPQYPRLGPQMRWLTPIFHPNIASGGTICLGGYSTHWVPSLMLDQLCEMLWDMLCFRNFNLASPYNREAALWMQQQTTFHFPLSNAPLRRRENREQPVTAEVVFLSS